MVVVLAGVERSVYRDPVDSDEGAVQDHVAPVGAGRRGEGVGEAGRRRGEHVDGFVDVAAHRGDADAEPGGEAGVGVPAAQVRQHQQRLPSRGKPPPRRSDRGPVRPQRPGEELQRRGGQVDRRRVGQHLSPLVVVDLGRQPIYQGARPHHRRHTDVTPIPTVTRVGKGSMIKCQYGPPAPPPARRRGPRQSGGRAEP